MNASELIPLLGTSTNNSGIKKLLESLKIVKPLKVKRDEPRTDIEVKKEGWSMAFEDEDYLTNHSVTHYGNGDLILTTLFFYPEGYGSGYKAFTGEIIKGVSVSDNEKVIKAKLGSPQAKYVSDGIVRNERWNFGDYRFVVSYDTNYKVKTMSLLSQKYERRKWSE